MFHAASTFYFYPGAGCFGCRHKKDPHYNIHTQMMAAAVRQLAADGWEIGVHHSINAQSKEHYAEGRRVLAEIGGTNVVGGRSHYWSGNWSDPVATWRKMESAGFEHDASCSPLTLGYRGGTTLPVMPTAYLRQSRRSALVVLPTPVMDAYTIPRASDISREEIAARLTKLTENARRHGLILLDWHVRTLTNAGAWRGYMVSFLKLILPLVCDSACRFMKAGEVAEAWRRHVTSCCKIDDAIARQ
jgi:hypothetical protein